jgi:iron complex transport system permease protein
MAANVIFGIRLPRVIMAFIVGAGLSAAGVSLQAMFGNPLIISHIFWGGGGLSQRGFRGGPGVFA